ncbi:MAG: CBS domain-containing protein [Labilithrix sp.]|nr:CBS domain-containing protein [Labilithrix sp.]MCW5812539.1 CBS domain-containing protein [Labilithrix sp.]
MASREMKERIIPLRLCTTIAPAHETLRPFVVCPRTHQAIDAHTCAGCMRMRSLEWGPTSGGEVGCVVGDDEPPLDPRADFAEIAARTKVFDVIAPVATCVTPEVPLERVRELFANGVARTLPVVDDEGKLQGLVSRSDLVSAEGTVKDVMTPSAHALPYEAPLPYAVSLLAQEDVGEVPVVKLDGTVVGMCHALDVLRWVAAQLGYVARRS